MSNPFPYAKNNVADDYNATSGNIADTQTQTHRVCFHRGKKLSPQLK